MSPWWLSLFWALPLVCAWGVRRTRAAHTSTARWIAVAACTAVLAAALLVLALTPPRGLDGGTASPVVSSVDGLSAVLLPLVAGLALSVLLASPRADLDAGALASVLTALGGAMGVLVCSNAAQFVVMWCVSLAPLLSEARRSGDPVLGRSARWVTFASAVPIAWALVGAVWVAARAGVAHPFDIGAWRETGVLRGCDAWLGVPVVLGCAARMGVFPLHLWVPAALERGRTAVVAPVVISPIGSFAMVRLGVSLFPDLFARAAPWLVTWGVASALYGSLLALGQRDARRQLGHLWVSAAGVVTVGLGSFDPRGMSGALLHDVAGTISMTGLVLVVRAVQARAGTADLRRLGGLVQRAPRLATGFFLLAVASVGFPGSATFVSEDLVVQGLVRGHVVSAVLVLLAVAVNGVTLVRTFKQAFLGPASRNAPDMRRAEDMLPRERWVSLALVVALLAGGVLPSPVLALREIVVASLHHGGR